MKKFLLVLALVLIVAATSILAVSCNKNNSEIQEPQKTIVYLGDSIAEALIGPSPLSERDNYGYYALLGRTNGFKYYNHSVSGHKTSGSMMGEDIEGGMLALLQREGESATLMKTHIKEADIIHISILGNNLLQYDLGLLMMEVADPDFEEKYEAGKAANAENKTLINLLHDGGRATRYSVSKDQYGNRWEVNFNFPNSYQDICDIVSTLREMNPNAKIFFQKVYNPVFGGSKFLYSSLLQELAQITDDGRFGAEGTKITTIEQVRLVAQELLNKLNGMLDEYLENNPGSIYIIDANKAFDDYARTDVRNGKVYYGTLESNGADCKGADLMFSDWTHPSNLGHAVLAATTQAKFEELGLASPNALSVYKSIKVEQINRMYKDCEEFHTDVAIGLINGADSFEGVNFAYFNMVKSFTPKYGGEPQADTGMHFETTKRYSIKSKSSVAGYSYGFLSWVFEKDDSYFEFTSDGKVHAQIKTKAIMPMLESILTTFNVDLDSVASTIYDIDLDDAVVEPYVVEMFPGFTLDHVVDSFNLMKDSLGLYLIGFDLEDEGIRSIIADIERTHKVPEDILDKIPEDFTFGIAFDGVYHIKTVKDAEGNERQAIYVGGAVANNPNTQPFMIFTIDEDEYGRESLKLSVEFIMVSLLLTLAA